MSKEIKVNRPEIVVVSEETPRFNPSAEAKDNIAILEAGKHMVIDGLYSDGLSLLKDLNTHLNKKFSDSSFKDQREVRAQYHKLSNLMLLEIKDHKLAVKKAPNIGWIKKLYAEIKDFYLPFPQIQGLNSSWQWFQNGISIPVLRNKLHPYYGTYFPTRFEHLIMFDNWLKRYDGPKKSAMDVGVGSGVLSFQMVQYGFQKVFATDTNPNAIVGLTEFMGETKLSRKVELDLGHIFGKWEKPSELIVFNPPWLPVTSNNDKGDKAIYYDKSLFPEFFAGAKERLLPDGKIVILFSNLAQITKVTKDHPIEKELASGGRFVLDKHLTKSVKTASDKTKRDQNWREEENVELWVLAHKK